MIMHRINGTILLVTGILCYLVSALMGATQPPGTIYWAMSFPAMCRINLFSKLMTVIGVIGADLSNVVANMFATSNVSKEFQSISVAIVVTVLSLSQTIGQSIASALITGNLPTVIYLTVDIGGNGLSGTVPIEQLAKGFHAAFWLGFGVSVITAGLATTLKLGTRGHKGERDNRDTPIVPHNTQDITAVSHAESDYPTELVQRRERDPKR